MIRATRRDGATRVRVRRPTDTMVVLGSGSQPQLELNLNACRADGVPIHRRRGGGCSVVLDPGNVIVSVVMTGLPFGHHRRHFDTLTHWLIDGLTCIGIPGIRQAGICDLALAEKKVGGACLHRSRDLMYYSASLLIAPDLDRVCRYLKHPPREPDYRRGRRHASFMGSLKAAFNTYRSLDPVTGIETGRVATNLRNALQPPVLACTTERDREISQDGATPTAAPARRRGTRCPARSVGPQPCESGSA